MGSSYKKKKTVRNRDTCIARTARNKKIRAEKENKKLKKLQQKQEKRFEKLQQKLSEHQIEWNRTPERPIRYELKYMERKLKKLTRK